MFTLNRNHIFLIGLLTAFLFAGINILNFVIVSDFANGKVSAWYGNQPWVDFYLDGKLIQFAGEADTFVNLNGEVTVIYETSNPKNAAIFSFSGFFLRYFYFLVLPLLIFTAFIYSYFGRYDTVTVNFRKDAEQRISKNKRLN